MLTSCWRIKSFEFCFCDDNLRGKKSQQVKKWTNGLLRKCIYSTNDKRLVIIQTHAFVVFLNSCICRVPKLMHLSFSKLMHLSFFQTDAFVVLRNWCISLTNGLSFFSFVKLKIFEKKLKKKILKQIWKIFQKS